MNVTTADYAARSTTRAVPDTILTAVLAAAQRDINAITFERAAGPLSEKQEEIVRQCIIDQADFRHQYAEMLENPLASYSINGVSMSWDTSKIRLRNGVYTSMQIETQLIRAGLMYRGVR